MPADPLGDGRGVRQVARRPSRGRAIPIPQPVDDYFLEAKEARRLARKVVVELVPRVAHRRVAVAEVRHARGRARSLRDAVRRGDHEVETGKVEGLDGARKEREELTVAAAREGQAVQEGRADRVALDPGGDRSRHVKEREDGGVRDEREDLLEDLLAAAHAVQPVVNDGGSHDGRLPAPVSASAYTSRVLSAAFSHEKSRARLRPSST